ncbi:ApeA N-terminal domain 1-containing protein [Paractinoplanes deccanensis]|uniref:ApeA N-terminal domain 1-containing protein n=1 Tax=Paractinoplanes deccanensis TaxID=113561 RepID=UPI0019454208|nr:hypothetical protein [Actinoplanes deccanensis]
MGDEILAIADGVMGWFWPGFDGPKDTDSDYERGYLSLTAPDTFELKTLDEDSFRDELLSHLPYPRLITGSTEHGTVLLLDFKGAGQKIRMGGAASARHYRGRTILRDVPIEKIRSERLKSISAHFFGISSWFGLSTSVESLGHRDDGKLKSFTIAVESQPEQSIRLSGGRELVLSAHWYTRGSTDKRIIHAPVELSCRSVGRAESLWNLRQPLLRVQDLLSFCYEGFIAAESGRATPDVDGAEIDRSQLWDGWLMAAPTGATAAKSRDFPLLRLEDIGGLPALRRWIVLCDNHLRAVRPIIEPYRQGRASAPLRLLEIAAAMEYWVAAHRRRRVKWVKEKCCKKGSQGCGWSWPIARHVGGHFDRWVGDSREWSHRFWSAYNKLKHEPEYVANEVELGILADSASMLLSVALLCRISGNKEPARKLFADTSHTWQLQKRIHALLQEQRA